MHSDKINFSSTLLHKYPKTILCLALCTLTIATYWPVTGFPFINFDDNLYVFENSHVKSGLSIQNILWTISLSDAATDENKNYWHPLTWISLMIDVQLFGVDAQMHHASNLFFHTLNVILLFLLFYRLTGEIWKCFFIAVLFGLHPMNIESTAWIAERKNLLSTTFWLVTMFAYAFYAKKPSFSRYLLVCISFGFGLLAKPILAVLPFVLLLLDYWPLNRIKWLDGRTTGNCNDSKILTKSTFVRTPLPRLILEKVPLFILSFFTIHLSMVTLQEKSRVITTEMIPIFLRIENAIVSYVIYIYKLMWPVDLAVFYPFPDTIPAWHTFGAIVLLLIISGFTLIKSTSKPYLIFGWFWFLGVLFPASGLIQGGLWPAMADRWAYVPYIGLFIIFAWGIPDILPKWHYKKVFLSVSGGCLIIILCGMTRFQLAYWTDTYTLFNRAIAVTENNFFAYNVAGDELALKGDYKTAEKYFLTVLEIKPDDADAMMGLGQLAFKNKNYDRSLKYYQKSLDARPDNAETLTMIGEILSLTGKTDMAIYYYSKALILNPSDPEIYNQLGIAFFSKHAFEQARKKFVTAVRLNPKFDEAYYNLGLVSLKQGNTNEALMHYKKAISINPNYANAHKSLADVLFLKGDMAQAYKHYSEVIRFNPEDAATHYNIGVILFQQQQIKSANEHFYKALQFDNSYEKARIALAMTRNILESEK